MSDEVREVVSSLRRESRIVEGHCSEYSLSGACDAMDDAADLIERLARELAEARGSLSAAEAIIVRLSTDCKDAEFSARQASEATERMHQSWAPLLLRAESAEAQLAELRERIAKAYTTTAKFRTLGDGEAECVYTYVASLDGKRVALVAVE